MHINIAYFLFLLSCLVRVDSTALADTLDVRASKNVAKCITLLFDSKMMDVVVALDKRQSARVHLGQLAEFPRLLKEAGVHEKKLWDIKRRIDQWIELNKGRSTVVGEVARKLKGSWASGQNLVIAALGRNAAFPAPAVALKFATDLIRINHSIIQLTTQELEQMRQSPEYALAVERSADTTKPLEEDHIVEAFRTHLQSGYETVPHLLLIGITAEDSAEMIASVFIHEAIHAYDADLLQTWIKANQELIKHSQTPDPLYANYVFQVGKHTFINRAFTHIFIESRAYKGQTLLYLPTASASDISALDEEMRDSAVEQLLQDQRVKSLIDRMYGIKGCLRRDNVFEIGEVWAQIIQNTIEKAKGLN